MIELQSALGASLSRSMGSETYTKFRKNNYLRGNASGKDVLKFNLLGPSPTMPSFHYRLIIRFGFGALMPRRGSRTIPTRTIPTGQFPPRTIPTRTTPTRTIPTLDNSHPGQFPPGKLPPGQIPPWTISTRTIPTPPGRFGAKK